MKRWKIVLVLSLLAGFAFAASSDDSEEGEEEEEAPVEMICYKAESVVPAEIPDRFCFSKPVLFMVDRTLNFAEATENFPTTIPLLEANIKAGGQIQYEALARIVEQWGAECAKQFNADLRIYGETNWNGEINMNEMFVELLIDKAEDKCRLPEPIKIEYKQEE